MRSTNLLGFLIVDYSYIKLRFNFSKMMYFNTFHHIYHVFALTVYSIGDCVFCFCFGYFETSLFWLSISNIVFNCLTSMSWCPFLLRYRSFVLSYIFLFCCLLWCPLDFSFCEMYLLKLAEIVLIMLGLFKMPVLLQFMLLCFGVLCFSWLMMTSSFFFFYLHFVLFGKKNGSF